MTAVILAAGIAARLRPITNTIPKPLLSLGGKPLLRRIIESLRANNVRRCVLVTGYLHSMIESAALEWSSGMEIEMVHNPIFDHTNNNYSLWLSRDAVRGQDILLLDGDILFDSRILTNIILSPHGDALVMRASNTLGEEEIKCQLGGDGSVRHIGKHLTPALCAGESLGIEKFSGPTTAQLFDVLSRRHVKNEFYEASFQEVIDAGAKVFVVDSGGLACMEIDTPDDLVAAETLAASLP